MSEEIKEVVNGDFTELEFDNYLSQKMRVLWTKIESSKNLLRNGQQVVSYEQLQGVSDGVKHLVNNIERRVVELGGSIDESNSD